MLTLVNETPTHEDLHRLDDEMRRLGVDTDEVPFSVNCFRCKRDAR